MRILVVGSNSLAMSLASRFRKAGHMAATYQNLEDLPGLRTIGRSRAVGVVKGVRVSGFVAWALWLGIHVAYLIGVENRLLVLTRWTFSYLTRGRGARVIHRN